MNNTSLEIRILATEVEDAVVQNDYLSLLDALEILNPAAIGIGDDRPAKFRTPKSDVQFVIGAVKVAIPAAAAARVLTAWIKGYYGARTARKIQIKASDGRALTLTGFDEKEITRFLTGQNAILSPGENSGS